MQVFFVFIVFNDLCIRDFLGENFVCLKIKCGDKIVAFGVKEKFVSMGKWLL